MADRKPGEGCKGCTYRRRLFGGGGMACHYPIINDDLRGCPAGAGCLRYKPKRCSLKKQKEE